MVYRSICRKAVQIDRNLAVAYIRHTVFDAPLAEAVVNAMADMDGRKLNEAVNACMQTAERSHYHACRKRRSIFESAKFPPHWLDGGP